MKRLNPNTGFSFRRGDLREDNFIFCCYTSRLKSNGYFYESWYSPDAWKRHRILKLDWQRENQKLHNQRSSKWQKENRSICNFLLAKYKSNKKLRTPPWLTDNDYEQIKLWYTRANLASIFLGEKYEVDHIVPLQGRNVSGLHVPWNLQILTKKENVKKGNKI